MAKVLTKVASIRRKTTSSNDSSSKLELFNLEQKFLTPSNVNSTRNNTKDNTKDNAKDNTTTNKTTTNLSSNNSSNNSSNSLSNNLTPSPPLPAFLPASHQSNLRSKSSTGSPSLTKAPPANHDNDKLIKSLLKQYKRLEVQLNRFNSKKYNNSKNSGILKSNILRTSLLPFLRNARPLQKYFDKNSKVYKSLISVITAILLKWWSALLGNLKTNVVTSTNPISSPHLPQLASYPITYSPIPAADRNAYLESISRIVARDDWNWNLVDKDFHRQFTTLLTFTLDYCVDKMTTLKSLSLSISAFIGKIFAVSFFNLPNVSNALLFLLNVKHSMFESTLNIIASSNTKTDKLILDTLRSSFPSHLHHLIDFRGIKFPPLQQTYFLNCVPPPKHAVDGIKDPNGSWVRRWCNCDSNVFNSFFRHYVNILQETLANSSEIIDAKSQLSLLLSSPGFTVIFSHVFQIFQVSITRICSSQSSKFQQPPNAYNPSPFSTGSDNNEGKQSIQTSNNGQPIQSSAPPDSTMNIKQADIYYNSIIKIFKSLRDITYSSSLKTNDKSIDIVATALIKFVDESLGSVAKDTNVYDYNRNSLVLNIVYEFINHVQNNINISNVVNWEFWISCNFMMLNSTDHIQILLKNLAFLFNVWDMIPESLSHFRSLDSPLDQSSDLPSHYRWLTNLDDSFKLNFINWLVSNEVFERFLIHWNPIVRSYYLRFLIWRIIGINNYQSSILIKITRKVQHKIDKSFDLLHRFTVFNNQNGIGPLNFKPDNPLVNRKLCILPFNSKDDGASFQKDENGQSYIPATPIKSSELRKTHSYEVFDEAIYSCSSLPIGPTNDSDDTLDISKDDVNELLFVKIDNSSTSSSKSIVSSLGKLFRYLSTEDPEPVAVVGKSRGNELPKSRESNKNGINDRSFKYKRNSVSLTSLSTTYSSLKSRSSSPSLLSFNSIPTSITESASSSITSDSDSTSSSVQTIELLNRNKDTSNSQPPEFFKLPPEIVRPIYKFDIVIDHESMGEKFNLIHHKNYLMNQKRGATQTRARKVSYFPLQPRIPLISIFVNSDAHNTFYINDEEGLYIENFPEDDDNASHDTRAANHQELEIHELFSDLNDLHRNTRGHNLIKMTNLGRSMNEMNLMIDEFKNFLNRRIEIDQFFQDFSSTPNYNEFDYFKKIIPFLAVDCSNEAKLINAS